MSSSDSSVSSNNTATSDQHDIPVWSHFPPPSLDPQDAGVSDLFAKVYAIAHSEGVAMNELMEIGHHIGMTEFDDDPPPSYLDKKDPNYFCYSDLKRAMDGRPEVWYQSFVFEVVTLLGTCLTFRKTNGSKTTAPAETSNVSNYFIPSRTLHDFVRSLEIVCDTHFNHCPTQEETDALQEKFRTLRPHDGFRGRWELKDFIEENCDNPYGEFLHDVRKRDIDVQTDPIFFSPPEEKQQQQPPSVHHVSTQTDSVLPNTQTFHKEEKESEQLPSDNSRFTQTLSCASFEKPSLEQPVCSPKLLPKQEESPPKPMLMEISSSLSPNTTTSPPSPKPTSQSSGSSRHSPTRVPTKPHIVLSRVDGASMMDYRDVRRAWDSALDGFSPPSADLFRSRNIHRLRHLGHTGIGIIFRQIPSHKQLKRFVASCLKQQGRDAFNSVFCSVSSGVHVSMYDEQHQSPPYPTQLRFGGARKTQQWTPPPPIYSTQPPQHQPYLPPKHFQPRRPSPPRFPMPSFGNAFSTQPTQPPPPQHVQQQLTHLQQQIQQLMQMQTHILQQLQHMKHNGF